MTEELEEKPIPEAWIGRRVFLQLSTGTISGDLRAVSDRGVVIEEPEGGSVAFCPWEGIAMISTSRG